VGGKKGNGRRIGTQIPKEDVCKKKGKVERRAARKREGTSESTENKKKTNLPSQGGRTFILEKYTKGGVCNA